MSVHRGVRRRRNGRIIVLRAAPSSRRDLCGLRTPISTFPQAEGGKDPNDRCAWQWAPTLPWGPSFPHYTVWNQPSTFNRTSCTRTARNQVYTYVIITFWTIFYRRHVFSSARKETFWGLTNILFWSDLLSAETAELTEQVLTAQLELSFDV